jgi:protein ImuB
MILCLLLDQPSETAVAAITERAPRIAVEAGARVWVDARGLDIALLYEKMRRAVKPTGIGCRGGAAVLPVAAQLAAGASEVGRLVVVGAGTEREYIAPFPLSALEADASLLAMLEDVGVSSCGELGSLPREAIEVRFGPESVPLWRLSRGEDERRLFRPQPPEAPHASIDFIDYVVTDPERLLFTGNALLGTICDALVERGSHARGMLIMWLRLLRSLLERLTVSDSVAGMHLEVRASQAASAVQGDLFDSGFATASAVEEAVSRLLEQHDEVVVRPVLSQHPLVEARVTYEAAAPAAVSSSVRELPRSGAAQPRGAGELTLQLLEQPKPVLVESIRRRDHEVPVRYRDGAAWFSLLHAAGPDRLSGGQWDQSYAREYYRAVTTEGTLVWLYRDACKDRWYLHGWWD